MAITMPLSSVSSSLAQKTVLQQCQEELNPELLASYDQKSTLWKVAAIATLVAFTALMIGGFIATALYAPVFIPIIGITSLILLSQINRVYRTFDNWSTQSHERADQLREINRHYHELSGSTPAQIQQILRQKGIHNVTGMQYNDPNLTTLKPLIARHLFWEGHVEKLQKLKQEKLDEAAKLTSESFTDHREEIYDLRSEALELEKQALESKVKNSFINAALRRPHFAGTLADVGTFSALSGQERAAGIPMNVAGAGEFFTFKARNVAPIQYNEVKQIGVADLAMRMLAAMPA